MANTTHLRQRYKNKGFTLNLLRCFDESEDVLEAPDGEFAVIYNAYMSAVFSVENNSSGQRIINTCIKYSNKEENIEWPSTIDNPTILYEVLSCVKENVEIFKEFSRMAWQKT